MSTKKNRRHQIADLELFKRQARERKKLKQEKTFLQKYGAKFEEMTCDDKRRMAKELDWPLNQVSKTIDRCWEKQRRIKLDIALATGKAGVKLNPSKTEQSK
jgi:hypothetical protein